MKLFILNYSFIFWVVTKRYLFHSFTFAYHFNTRTVERINETTYLKHFANFSKEHMLCMSSEIIYNCILIIITTSTSKTALLWQNCCDWIKLRIYEYTIVIDWDHVSGLAACRSRWYSKSLHLFYASFSLLKLYSF